MQQVTARIPASTSNLGPGFDCLGVALRLYDTITVRRSRGTVLPLMARQTAKRFFAATRQSRFEFSCTIAGDIPIARGLGSSVAVRLGLLLALNELARTHWSREQLFALCAQLEGHPDNAAPATFGGFTVARGFDVQRFDVSPRLYFVLLVPDFEVRTARARALMPRKIPHGAAVTSVGNAAAITAAFVAHDYNKLRGCFADGLHQPYRKKLVPFLDAVAAAAEKAGALGAFLSGSGSSICALSLENPDKIGQAMRKVSSCANARLITTRADNRGARILRAKPR